MVVVMEETKDLSVMFVEYLTVSLLSHASRMNKYEGSTLENAFKYQVLVAKTIGRGRGDNSFDHGEHKDVVDSEKRTQ